MYKECRDIHFKLTPLPIRFNTQMVVFRYESNSKEIENPKSKYAFMEYIDTLFEESNHIRMIDINLCTFPLDIDPQRFRTFLKKVKRSLPKLKKIHVTIDVTAQGVRHFGPDRRHSLGFVLGKEETSLPFQCHLSQLLENEFCRNMVVVARILLDEELLDLLKPRGGEDLENWIPFLDQFASFPNLKELEVYIDLISPSRDRSSHTIEADKLTPIIRPLTTVLPQVQSFGLWRSRDRESQCNVRKRLRRNEERALIALLEGKIMEPNFDRMIIGKQDVVRGRKGEAFRPVFDFVPALDPDQWRISDDGELVKRQKRNRKRKADVH
jgi:hypothetical protein